MPTWPNFFILGAPKCGTTAMAAWLSQHPDVYISPLKEPKYFDRDLRTMFRLSAREYQTLFRDAAARQRAVGEATVWYLYSREAVPAIERQIPGARYVAMVRNPVEMAYALHEQMYAARMEHMEDFGAAWRLSPLRRHRRAVRPWVIEPRRLDYQAVCRLGEQMRRLTESVDRGRILTLVMDDLRQDPGREYRKVLEFLGVADDGRTDFSVINPAKRVRSQLLQSLLTIVKKGQVVARAKLHMPAADSQVLQQLYALNTAPRPRTPLPADLKEEMKQYFAEDVRLLSQVLQRDLGHWL